MIKRYRRNDRRSRLVNHVGGINPPAKSGFKDQDISRTARKCKECGGLGDFKECYGFAVIDRFDFFKKVTQRIFGNHVTGKGDAFMETHQMRGCRTMDLKSGGLIDGAQIGLGGAFAICTGKMNDRWQGKVRITQLVQKPGNPP